MILSQERKRRVQKRKKSKRTNKYEKGVPAKYLKNKKNYKAWKFGYLSLLIKNPIGNKY